MSHRSDVACDGEPLFSSTRKVQSPGNGTLHHTIPTEARDLLGIEPGTEVEIAIRENSYTVTVADQEE